MKQVKPCPFECNANDCKDCGAYTYSHHTQTNEEWVKQCDTEQFAWWLKKHMNCNFCPMRLKCEDMRDCMEHIKAWLKQPHSRGVTEIDMRAK